MASKWDEITQLEEAYNALKTQPWEAQQRMLTWLGARLKSDFEAAMASREAETRKRIADRSTDNGQPQP